VSTGKCSQALQERLASLFLVRQSNPLLVLPHPEHEALRFSETSVTLHHSPWCTLASTLLGSCVFIYSGSISIVKPTRCTNVSNLFYFGMTLYMFRTVFPSIIRSSRLYIQQYLFDSCMYSLELLMMDGKTV